MEVFVKEICCRLKGLLNSKIQMEGTVHSVFNRMFNICFEKLPIIALTFDSVPIKPMAISLKGIEAVSMHEIGLEVGQRVLYNNNCIEIKNADLNICFDDFEIIDSRPNFNFERTELEEVYSNILALRDALKCANDKGLLPIVYEFEKAFEKPQSKINQNRYSEFAWPRIKALIWEIRQKNLKGITKASRAIAGFGPGLTPSSDDMLIGLMVSLIYSSYYYDWPKGQVEDINSAILKGADSRTTRLSYEMMSFAAQGEVTSNIHQLMKSIYSKSNQLLYKSILDIMDYGETSGADLLSGIYIGCKI